MSSASRGKSGPQSPNLLVHARLKTIDGRQFDTSQSIHIVPPTATAQAATQPVAPPHRTHGPANRRTTTAASSGSQPRHGDDQDARTLTCARVRLVVGAIGCRESEARLK